MSLKPSEPLFSIGTTPEAVPHLRGSTGQIDLDELSTFRTSLFRPAAESIWASLGLLALNQPGQAYLLLMQAAEVALKGVVDDIFKSGIAKFSAMRPDLLGTAISNNASLESSTLNEILNNDGFIRSFRFVNDVLDLSNYSSSYQNLYRTRNDIAHDGS